MQERCLLPGPRPIASEPVPKGWGAAGAGLLGAGCGVRAGHWGPLGRWQPLSGLWSLVSRQPQGCYGLEVQIPGTAPASATRHGGRTKPSRSVQVPTPPLPHPQFQPTRPAPIRPNCGLRYPGCSQLLPEKGNPGPHTLASVSQNTQQEGRAFGEIICLGKDLMKVGSSHPHS